MRYIRTIYILIFLLILLAACTPAAVPVITPNQTDPSKTSELPPLTLAEFSTELKSKGVHGAMVCYTYNGDPDELSGLTLTARFLRGDEIIEKRIPAEVVEGESCFEMTDASYLTISPNQEGGRLIIPDQALTVRIDAKSENGQEIINNYQSIALGKYVQFPFLGWIFPEESAPGCLAGGHVRDGMHYPAWDFIPSPTDEHPKVVGTPVLAPVDGFFYLTSFSKDENPHEKVNTVMIYSPDTGFLVNLTHVYELVLQDGEWQLLDDFVGKEVSAGEQVGMIAPRDFVSTVPHTHLQILIPPNPINTSRALTPGEMNEIYVHLIDNNIANLDFIAEEMFLDPKLNEELIALSADKSACEIDEWGEITFPQQLPLAIDGRADDWAGYETVLIDSSEDSAKSKMMDLSELYLAIDENYLYLMLDAGEKPPESSTDWSFYFHLDLNIDNGCGSTDRIIKLWAEDPYAFEVYSLDKCDDTLSKQYPVTYVWDEVLELKIHLAYLKNPQQITALDVTGYLIDPLDQHIIQDLIP